MNNIAVMVWVLSAGLIVWVLFGYPVLLMLLVRSRSRPVHKQFQPRTVSVVLAVSNGAAFLRRKLESLLNLNYPRELMQLLVISDGSTDGTEDIAREFASRGVELIAVPKSGKAGALNAGIARATGEILFFTDVRQTLDRDSLRHLVACFADPETGVVSGELIILDGQTLEEASVGLYWKYEKWIRKHQSNLDSLSGATGAVYAMRRELAVPLPPNTLLDDVHQPLAAFFRGYRLLFEPAARAYDLSASLDAEFHRKVRTLAGMYQVMVAYPALLGPKNRMWVHFMSHKFSRLLLPFALIAAFISSFYLPSPLNWIALSGQIGLYALALADTFVPNGSMLKKVSAASRTFVVLMAATLVAASILYRSPESFWKTSRINPLKASPTSPTAVSAETQLPR
ncbi:MAG: glycosyltransferase family 2 protein [Bryobacteraceae bacterium]